MAKQAYPIEADKLGRLLAVIETFAGQAMQVKEEFATAGIERAYFRITAYSDPERRNEIYSGLAALRIDNRITIEDFRELMRFLWKEIADSSGQGITTGNELEENIMAPKFFEQYIPPAEE